MAATPNVDTDFPEFCETLREKYDMTEGDWMALLNHGQTLFNRLPEGTISREESRRRARRFALAAVEDVERDMDRVLDTLSERLHDKAFLKQAEVEVDAGSEEQKSSTLARGTAWAMLIFQPLIRDRINKASRMILDGDHSLREPAESVADRWMRVEEWNAYLKRLDETNPLPCASRGAN